MNILTTRGSFWWADAEIPAGQRTPPATQAVNGEITIEDNGRTTLTLDEHLLRPDSPKSFRIRAYEKSYEIKEIGIAGVLRNNDRVLLHGLMGDLGFRKSATVRDCYIGHKALPYENGNFKFKQMSVSLKGFEGWLHMGNIKTVESGRSIKIGYRNPKPLSYQVNGHKLTIDYGMKLQFNGMTSDEISLKQTASLNKIFSTPVDITAIKDTLRSLQQFFILLTNSETRLEWPLVVSETNGESYRYYFLRNSHTTEPLEWHETFTNLNELNHSFGRLLKKWEQYSAKFGSGFYIYFSTRSGLKSHTESVFLDLMMGLESFHRHKFPKEKISKFVELRKRSLAQIKTKKELDWLNGRLKYAHEPNAEMRLNKILNDISPSLATKRISKFVQECVFLRNDIVHSLERTKDRNFWLQNLDLKSDALAALYHLLLLKEIGLSQEAIDKILSRRFIIRMPLISAKLIDDKDP